MDWRLCDNNYDQKKESRYNRHTGKKTESKVNISSRRGRFKYNRDSRNHASKRKEKLYGL
jgi:hypothetical protein